MALEAFPARHIPALERDEVRHNLILALLLDAERGRGPALRRWDLGGPGACAVQTPGMPIVLGALTRAQCRALADETAAPELPGATGPGRTAVWFKERARELGLAFLEPMPLTISALAAPPVFPDVPGGARKVTGADGGLFADWVTAFVGEAVPNDPLPSREELGRVPEEDRHLFWVVEGRPVSMAGIARRTRRAAAISLVYTPPDLRGRGYAGAVTAAVVARIQAEGRKTACLSIDVRNPASNRCYEKIGFRPVCEAWSCWRKVR